jgi:hypothetical protein
VTAPGVLESVDDSDFLGSFGLSPLAYSANRSVGISLARCRRGKPWYRDRPCWFDMVVGREIDVYVLSI